MIKQKECNFEKWLWIELIAFDNQQKDFGIKGYFDNTGFVPDGLSLLIVSPDFVHTYDGMKEDENFPPDFCSYLGRAYEGKERSQIWTKYQLKELIEVLHSYQIKVYFAVFDMFLDNKFHEEWADKHREILSTTRGGEKINSINPLARLKDGSYYEDFFIKNLLEVTEDYGFDGYHIADGYCHLRYPLSEIDYSDDIINQFIENTGVKFPEDISGKCRDNKTLLKKRADWIWRNKRIDWINFFVKRWERFCRKVVTSLHNEGKQVIFNTSWARDPFEAIYRYGIDYRKIADTGVDMFIIEAVGACVEIGGQGYTTYSNFFYAILATSLLTKAQVPGMRINFLNATRDITEGWDVLRHAPAFLEREIYTYANLYYRDSCGEIKRCFEGLIACLSQDIHHEEWTWLQDKWNLGFSIIPQSIIGPTLVWSEKAFENQLSDFVDTRSATTHKILYELMAKGASICSVVDVAHIENMKGPLLVINHHLFPEEELRGILTYKNGPIVLVGKKARLSPEPDSQFEDTYSPNQLSCNIYGLKKKFEVNIKKDEEERIPDDMAGVEEPLFFTRELYFRRISDSFLMSCVEVISHIANTIKVSQKSFEIIGAGLQKNGEGKILCGETVKVLGLKKKEGELRLLIGNDSHLYANPEVDIGKDIDNIKILTEFPGKLIIPEGSKFRVIVPGKGMVILDVTLKKHQKSSQNFLKDNGKTL